MNINQVLTNIKAGDKSAKKELFNICGYAVYNRALEKSGNRDIASDTTKKVFSELYKKLICDTSYEINDKTLNRELRELTDKVCMSYIALSSISESVAEEIEEKEQVAENPSVNKNENKDTEEKEALEIKDNDEPEEKEEKIITDESENTDKLEDENEDKEEEKVNKVPQYSYAEFLLNEAKNETAESAYIPISREETVQQQKTVSNVPEEDAVKYKGGTALRVFLIILIIFLSVILVWLIVGFCMGMGIIPKYDFGYSWFDSNIYTLFNL